MSTRFLLPMDRFVLYNPPQPLPWSWNSGGHYSLYLRKAVETFQAELSGNTSPQGEGAGHFYRTAQLEQIRRHVFHEDGDFVTFYDGYPKATAHVLIVPKLEVADGLAAFLFQQTPPGIGGSSCHMAGEKEDNDKEGEGQRQGQRGSSFQASELLTQDFALAKLARLEAYQGRVVAMLRRLFPRLTFRHGVHAEPSLHQLHVHVISEDFRAAALKNRKHWLSFQPPFLVPLAHVRELVAGSLSGSLAGSGTQTAAAQQGRLREEVPEEQLAKYLKQCASDGAGANNSELKCCCADGPVFPTMPALKRHLETCMEKRPPWPPPPQGIGGSANNRFGAEDADSRSAKRRKIEEGTSEECDL
mmetsp:Transcript_27512/g.69377  ORF Transcript_27512/g.69377 Transcript_27512/m.69377 type:complete len:359 (-) Transcript_27512:40-1116(-)